MPETTSTEILDHWVGGTAFAGASTRTSPVYNPAEGTVSREVRLASTADVDAAVQIAKKAEEVGLDVFAIGEHHNPPFFSSSPTTLLAYIAAAKIGRAS